MKISKKLKQTIDFELAQNKNFQIPISRFGEDYYNYALEIIKYLKYKGIYSTLEDKPLLNMYFITVYNDEISKRKDKIEKIKIKIYDNRK